MKIITEGNLNNLKLPINLTLFAILFMKVFAFSAFWCGVTITILGIWWIMSIVYNLFSVTRVDVLKRLEVQEQLLNNHGETLNNILTNYGKIRINTDFLRTTEQ